ncbi:hypothetical protein EV121DRAFT_296764 [Schizophyllum commune]
MSRPTAQQARHHRQAQSRPPRRRPPEDASDAPDIAFDTWRNHGLVVLAISDASPCAKKSHFDAKCAEGEGGWGREAARSAAGDADDAQGIFWRFFKHLYLLPSLVNNFIRPFHVASSAPLHPFLKVKAPLSLKQRIFVRRATIFSLQMRSALRPSPRVEATYLLPPSKGSPRSLRVPPPPPPPMRSPLALPRRPLDVEATYRRPPSAALLRPSLRLSPSDDVRAPLGDAQ